MIKIIPNINKKKRSVLMLQPNIPHHYYQQIVDKIVDKCRWN